MFQHSFQTKLSMPVESISGLKPLHRNEVLLTFLKNLETERAYLSPGPDGSLHEKAAEFIEKAHEHSIELHLLVGNNELIRPEDQQMKLKALVNQAVKLGFEGIHLDVEPHAFDDWDNRQTLYEQQYVTMLANAAAISSANNLSISVSIPHFYDSILDDINQSADEIVVMVYETQDLGVLKKRIEGESEIFGDKFHVAIRPSDFANFDDLNTFVQQIMSQTGAQDVVLHDAGSLLNIENRGR